MKSASAIVRDRLIGKPLIGFGGKTVRAPRAKVGITLPETKPGA